MARAAGTGSRSRKKKVEEVVEAPIDLTLAPLDGPITEVRSNIKGGVSLALGACTAIVSTQNRAGKTTVLDAIRFGLTGRHPIGPHYADLCGLTPDGSPPYAQLYGRLGLVAYSDLPNGAKTVRHEGPEGNLLPLLGVSELLSLGTARAREEVLSRFGDPDEAMQTPAGFDEVQTELWNEALVAAPGGDTSVRLAGASAWMRRTKLQISAQLKSRDEEHTRLTAATQNASTDVAVLRKQLEAHQTRRKVQPLEGWLRQMQARYQELVELLAQPVEAPPDAAVHEAAQQREAAQQTVARLDQQFQQMSVNRDVLVRLLKIGAASGEGTCLACNAEKHAGRDEYLRQLDQQKAQMESMLAPVAAELEQAKQVLANASGLHARVKWDFDSAVTIATQARIQLEREKIELERDWPARKATFDNFVGSGVDLTVPVDPAEESRLTEAIAAAEAAAGNQARLTAIDIERRALRRKQAAMAEVDAALTDALAALLTRTKAKAEAAVNAWMPPGFTAQLQIDDGSMCRWASVGSDGVAHPKGGASGAEWGALTVALACAWSEHERHRFLLLDDMDLAGFSAENVCKFLTAIEEAVRSGRLTQAVVAWSRPSEIPDEGWSVVRLS